jgi:hypothetical protein
MACLAFVGDERICYLSALQACFCHVHPAITSQETFFLYACVSDVMGMRRSDVGDWFLLRLEADCGVIRALCACDVGPCARVATYSGGRSNGIGC